MTSPMGVVRERVHPDRFQWCWCGVPNGVPGGMVMGGLAIHCDPTNGEGRHGGEKVGSPREKGTSNTSGIDGNTLREQSSHPRDVQVRRQKRGKGKNGGGRKKGKGRDFESPPTPISRRKRSGDSPAFFVRNVRRAY